VAQRLREPPDRVAKVFSFRFVDTFSSLFYCAFKHSMLNIAVQLAAFMVIGQFAKNIVWQTLYPYLRMHYHNWKHAKELLIRLGFGGSFKAWKKDVKAVGIALADPPADLAAAIAGFESEYNILRKKVSKGGIVPSKFYRIMKNRGGSSRADDDDDDTEGKPDGSALALYLQTLECELKEGVLSNLRQCGWR
jgi:hypothetical protein